MRKLHRWKMFSLCIHRFIRDAGKGSERRPRARCAMPPSRTEASSAVGIAKGAAYRPGFEVTIVWITF
jgi:hypothetical protein